MGTGEITYNRKFLPQPDGGTMKCDTWSDPLSHSPYFLKMHRRAPGVTLRIIWTMFDFDTAMHPPV